MKNIIVCGAGIGGLVSAAYLAKNGHRVKLFEKENKPGGKASEYSNDGYRFDTGPVKFTAPLVIQDFFKKLGLNISDYVDMTEHEINSKYFWSDATVFNFYSGREKLSPELRHVFGETEEKNFFRYLNFAKLFYDLTKENFLSEEFKVRNYISKEGLKNFTKFISGRSVNDVSNKFFKENKLKQLMNRFATYNGSTPYLAPQFFSVIPYVEYKAGTWSVDGGFYKLIEALEKVCNELGVEFHYGHELHEFDSNDTKITKLKFIDGNGKEQIEGSFDSAVFNFTNNEKLMEDNYYENDDWSCSAFVMLAGMNKQYSGLSSYNVLFSDNYEKEFIEIFEKKRPADDMTINISVSENENSNDSSWQIHVNAPFISNNYEWTGYNTEKYKERILGRIESFTYLFDDSIRNHMKFCEIITPVDYLQRFNSERGSIHGLSSNSLYTLIRRPKNKSKKFDNVFFTGGNVYPGGGVSLCFLSGKIAAELAVKNEIPHK